MTLCLHLIAALLRVRRFEKRAAISWRCYYVPQDAAKGRGSGINAFGGLLQR